MRASYAVGEDSRMDVRFYFGAMSPYSWFAAERIGGLLPAATWVPVFAAAVFKANGRTTWGLTDERAAKLADCEARAREHGLAPIVWPDPWPTNDILVARALVAAGQRGALRQLALTAMRLEFLEGHDLGELAAVRAAAARAGLDPDEIEAATADPSVKQALRENTDGAVARGVFGVPTVAIGETLFWGDDRLEEAVSLTI
jgi:2-hydroxychromene-2-carboxylate isomerase